MASSGDYGQTQVPLVFVEPSPRQTSGRKPEPERGSSRGFMGVLIVLLLGAAIAGAAVFYVMWQDALKDGTEAQKALQTRLDDTLKSNKQLTDEKATLTAQLASAQTALTPYGEIQRLQAATEAERQKIAQLLTVPSKVDYWRYHRPIDQSDPVIREPAERALKAKLEVLQKLSNDIGLWSRPAGPAPLPAAGTIRPSQPPT